jgi:hypothetical protein
VGNALLNRSRSCLKCGATIAVLFLSNRNELLKFLIVKDLFRDIQILLVLPNNDRDIIEMGHQFYPRFVSYSDSDFKGVIAVLEKIVRSHKINIEIPPKSNKKPIANQKSDP